jgi:glycosyltransferase EpsD
MVKHYVKPGMTGLAQVRGLRGDTSVEERVLADIEYIERWSILLDLAILIKTPFKAFNKTERYIAELEEDYARQENTADSATEREALDSTASQPEGKKKLLYAASSMLHINNFHLKYIEALRAEGYDVKIMARGEGADYNIPFEKRLISASNRACRGQIRSIFERENFDVLVLNTTLAAFHIRLCLKKRKRPRVVNIVHGYLFSSHIGKIKSTLLLMCERFVSSRTDDIIVMNKEDKRSAEKYKLCRGTVYYCRGMGASVTHESTSVDKIRRELMCQDKYVLAFVGELSERKNQEFLISCFTEVKERIPGAVLWLVGDGALKDNLKSFASRVDLSESVFFLGYKENVCDLIRASDLYVSASSIEGMPFNIIEAMGCGKTVLASSVKGHVDLIDDGTNGFLFKFGSSRQFVDTVYSIYKGDIAPDKEKIKAKYNEYSLDSVFEQTLNILTAAIKENPNKK